MTDTETKEAYADHLRRNGFYGGCKWLWDAALSTPGTYGWITDHQYINQAFAYFRGVAAMADQVERVERPAREIVLKNGSRILFLNGSKPDTLYGYDFAAVSVDVTKDMQDPVRAVLVPAMMASRGPVFWCAR